MNRKLDDKTLWNEAAKAGAYFGAVSVGCLCLKELSLLSNVNLLITAASVILWVVEFFGCILLMKEVMLSLRNRYENAKITDTFKLGRRAALMSGLLLASAQAIFIMKMPEARMNEVIDTLMAGLPGVVNRDQVEGALDSLPLVTFFSQWLYCYLYGTVLASVMSRYVFLQKLFGDFPPHRDDTPDQQ